MTAREADKTDRKPVIVVEGLNKSFDRKVLDNVSFTIYEGETVVIMGPSGCGKSTLLKHLVGDMQPDSGSVKLFGRDITRMGMEEKNEIRKRFGILFQSGALYGAMSVGENVALPIESHTNLSESVINIMVKMKLDLVGLRGYEHLTPAELSGGMKKRAGLARAIALDPEILFYDEPSAGLDPIMAAIIDQLIMDLSKKLGVTSVVVTHDMHSAFKIADRIIMLYSHVIEEGTSEDIRHSANPIVQQFVQGQIEGPINLRSDGPGLIDDLIGSE